MGPEEIPSIESNTTWEISDADKDDTYTTSGNDDDTSGGNEDDTSGQEC